MANIRTRMGRIEDRDGIMAGYLGIEMKSKRLPRFIAALGSLLGGLGGLAAGAVAIHGAATHRDVSAYEEQISALQSGQSEIVNRLEMQRTVFVADAAKKEFQIEWLRKTQSDIQNKLVSLQTDLTLESKERERQIKELKSMLDQITKELEQQQAIQNKLVNDVEVIETKIVGLNRTLEDLLIVVSDQRYILSRTRLLVLLNSLMINFNSLCDQFEDEQKTLFDVIKKAKRGELDPYVLTPLNLIEMLQNIMPNMQENEKFPFFPNIENAHFLYNIITPDVYFYNYTLIFILKMPLVHTKTFDFHKVTSLPTLVSENVFGFILPTDPFLLIDKEHKDYLMMPYEEHRNFCEEINTNVFMCKQSQPLRSVFYDSNCEVGHYLSSRTIPDSCEKRIMFLEDILLLQLMKDDSWIYVAPKVNTDIQINCESTTAPVSVDGSGFISLKNNCRIKYKRFVVESLKEFTRPVISNYTSTARLNDLITSSNVESVQPSMGSTNSILVLPFDLKKLAEISTVIGNIDNNLNYLYSLLIIPFTAFIVGVFFFIYRRNQSIRNPFRKWFKSPNIADSHGLQSKGISSYGKDEKAKQQLNKNDIIGPISYQCTPSHNDPNSEYVTMRVKVKKNVESPKVDSKFTNLKTNHEAESNYYSVPITTTKDDFSDEDHIYANYEDIVKEKLLKELKQNEPEQYTYN